MMTDLRSVLNTRCHEPLLRCARCGKTALGAIVEVATPIAAMQWRWLRIPAGWWVLMGQDPAKEPHVRCPNCLGAPIDEGGES